MSPSTSDIDRKIEQIHAAGKTTLPGFNRLHNYLRMKSRTYYAWHNKPYSSKLHWLILGAQLAVFAVIGLSFLVPTPVQAASITWSGGGTDGTCGGNAGDGNKWSCAANWTGGVVPTSADSVTFTSTSTKNANIDSAFAGTIANLTISSNYTGTIAIQRDLTVTAAYSQAGGTVVTSSGNISIATTFGLTGGTFTAPSGILSIGRGFTVSGSPTFNANGGTVDFTSTVSSVLACNNITFSHVTLTESGAAVKTVNSDCSLPVGNNPTIGSGTSALTLAGTLTGSGTIAFVTFTNTSGTLTGFSGFSASGNYTNTSGNLDFTGYASPAITGFATITAGTVSFPSGTTIAGIMTNGGTLNAPSGTLSLGSSFTNNGTFNANGGTLLFNSTISGRIITGTLTGTSALNNLTLNGVGGSWSVNAATTIAGDLTVTAGTLAGTNAIVVTGNVVGNGGLVNLTGGSFEQRVSANASFGTSTGSSAWNFSNLIFSNSGGSAVTITTSSGGTGTTTVSGVLSIGKAGDTATTAFDAGNRNWALSGTGGTPLQILSSPAAALTANTSTFTYSGNNASGNTTITTTPYYNLTISNSAETYVLAADTTITNNYTNANGILDVTASNYALTVGGNWTRTGGTFTARAGTVTMNSTMTGKTMTGDMTGVNSFYNLVFDGVGGGWTLSSSNKSTTNDLTIAHGSVAVSAVALTIGGSWTDNGSFNAGSQTVTFTSTSTGRTISGNLTGSNAFNALVFNGVGGGWSFSNDVDLTSFLTITNGAVTAPSGNLSIIGVFTNNGSFHHNNGTVIFKAVSGTTVYAGSFSDSNAFYNFVMSGAGTVRGPASATFEIDNDLTLNAGTFGSSTGTAALVRGNVIGNGGALAMSSGSFEQRVSGDKSFGSTTGSTAWSFINLTFSNSDTTSHTITTSTGGTGTITVGGVLAIGKAGDTDITNLDAGNRTWSLTGATGAPLQLLSSPAAILNANTSTFLYSGNNTTGNTVVPNVTYYNLNISGSSEIYVASGALTLTNMTMTAGTFQLGGALTITGNYSRTGGTFDVTSGQNYPITAYGSWNGAITAQAGTVTFTGTAPGRTITGTAIFYNLIFDDPGGQWTMSGNINVAQDFTITNGTLTSTPATLTICGAYTNHAHFINNNGTVTISSASCSGGSLNGDMVGDNAFYNLKAAGTTTTHQVTLNNDALVLGDFSPANSTSYFEVPEGVTLSVAGNAWGGIGTMGAGTLRLIATTPGHWISPGWGGGTGIDNVVVDGIGGTWKISSPYCNTTSEGSVFTKNLTILNGTLMLTSVNPTDDGGCYGLSPFKQTVIEGDFINHGTFSIGDNTIVYAGGSLSGNLTGDSSFYNLQYAGSLGSDIAIRNNLLIYGTTTNGHAMSIGGDFTATDDSPGSTVNLGSSLITVGGSFADPEGHVNAESSTLAMTGAGKTITAPNPLHNLTVSTGGAITQASNLALTGTLDISNGSLDASSSNYGLSVTGTWLGGNSSYTPQAGTVTLNGGNQSITGNNLFYNLSKSVTSPTTLTIAAGSTQAITGSLTLAGSDRNLLSLHSGTPGSQWNLTAPAAPALHYLSVKDSHNLGNVIVADSTIANEGDNTGWQFSQSSNPTAPVPVTATRLLMALPGQTFVNGSGITGTPSQAMAGTPLSATVYATDEHGQLASGFTGSVHLNSSDTQSSLPASLSLANGQATVQITLKTAGTTVLTASADGIVAGQSSLTVTPSAPSPLTSSLVSLTSTGTIGEGVTLVATIRDQYANPISGRKLTLTSSRASDQLGSFDATTAAGTTQIAVNATTSGTSTYDIQLDGMALGEASVMWSTTSSTSTSGADTINPVAKITAPSLAATGQTIRLKGTDSTDNTGIATYQWSFPDGSYALGDEASYLLPQAGEVNIRLTVTDKDGNSGTATTTILVTHAAPTNVTARYQGSNLVVSGSATKSATVVAYLLPNPTPYLGAADSVTGSFSITIPIQTAASGTYNLTTVAFPANVNQERWLGVVSQQVSSQPSQENTPDNPKVGSPVQPILITIPSKTSTLPLAIVSVGIGLAIGAFLFAYSERRKVRR